jgi:hypothetical protein
MWNWELNVIQLGRFKEEVGSITIGKGEVLRKFSLSK